MNFPLDIFKILCTCCWLIFNNEVTNKNIAHVKMWGQKYLDTFSRLKIKLQAIAALAK